MHLIEPSGLRSFAETDIQVDKILSLEEFLAQPEKSAVIELNTDTELELLTGHLERLSQILIRLDSAADGRGFSLAYQLRHSLGYDKSILASGHIIADQFPHALRCGFNAVVISDEQLQRQPIDHWLDALAAAPVPYRCQVGDADNGRRRTNLTVNDQTLSHLNEKYAALTTEQLMTDVFQKQLFGETALVSSFGAESAVLLDLLAKSNPDAPVLFIDTGKLFPQTIAYKQQLSKQLQLNNVITLKPDESRLHAKDGFGVLHKSDVDSCCHLRKVEPLQQALTTFDSWVSGRKSHQNSERQNLPIFEKSGTHIKINPLAKWSKEQVQNYMKTHNLPAHPLQQNGYESIGCAPCTTPVSDNENSRDGRWRGQNKTECGIHFTDTEKEATAKQDEIKNPYYAYYSNVGDSWAY